MTADNRSSKPKRRRRRTGRGGRGGGMSPIMWLAILVCVVGAVILFRSGGGGGDDTVGIGENQTVVTAPDTGGNEAVPAEQPRSGDVAIDEQQREIVPETPAGGAAATTPEPEAAAVEKQPEPEPEKPKATTTKRTQPRDTTPPPPPVQPVERGPWLVQVGSFGELKNAESEVDRLGALGWEASIKMSGTADGGVVHRVRIGFFNTRADAEAFIRQNRKHIRGAIPAHI